MQKLKKEDHQSFLSAVHMQNVIYFWFAFHVPFLSPQSKVNPCALGSYLSMVDPWYNLNIRSLGSMIPKMADMVQKQSILCWSDLWNISTVDSCLVLIIHPLRKCHHFTTLHFRQAGGTVLCLRNTGSCITSFTARKINMLNSPKPQLQWAELKDILTRCWNCKP